MIKKIAILGSTGSIGQSTLDVIKKDRKNFKVILLTIYSVFTFLHQKTGTIASSGLYIG